MKSEGKTLREEWEQGGKGAILSAFGKRGSKHWLWPEAFWRLQGWLCYVAALGRARPKVHGATEQAWPVGSNCCGQTFILRGKSLQSSLVRPSGDARLLHPSLRRARRCYHSETKAVGLVQPRTPSGAARGGGAPWVLQVKGKAQWVACAEVLLSPRLWSGSELGPASPVPERCDQVTLQAVMEAEGYSANGYKFRCKSDLRTCSVFASCAGST